VRCGFEAHGDYATDLAFLTEQAQRMVGNNIGCAYCALITFVVPVPPFDLLGCGVSVDGGAYGREEVFLA
jgi:hypothetical protein